MPRQTLPDDIAAMNMDEVKNAITECQAARDRLTRQQREQTKRLNRLRRRLADLALQPANDDISTDDADDADVLMND